MLVSFLQNARMRAAGVGKDFKENPNLRDNWTDAEGYYRKRLALSVMWICAEGAVPRRHAATLSGVTAFSSVV